MIFRVVLLIFFLSASVDNAFGASAQKYWKEFNYTDVFMGFKSLVPVGIEAVTLTNGDKKYQQLYLCRAWDGSQLYPGKLFIDVYVDGTAWCDFAGEMESQHKLIDKTNNFVEVLTIPPEYTSWVPNTSKNPELFIEAGRGGARANRRKICRTKVGDTIHIGYPNTDYSRCYYYTLTTYSANNFEVLAFNSLGRRYGM